MKKILLVAVLTLVSAAAAGVAQANHSGPEDVATGRGETATSSTVGIVIPGGTIVSSCRRPPAPAGASCIQITTETASRFDFDARLSSQEASTPLGEPHGHMKLWFSETTTQQNFFSGFPTGPPSSFTRSFSATAEVTCLNVVNNRAALSGRVTRFEGTVPPQRGLLFNATDNTIARQQVAPDQFAGTLQPEALQVCPPPSADAPITKGDIVVEKN
jgi:hypothetical protein